MHEHGGLDCLAQSHLIRENAIAAIDPVPHQPVGAFDLVGAETVSFLVLGICGEFAIDGDGGTPVRVAGQIGDISIARSELMRDNKNE